MSDVGRYRRLYSRLWRHPGFHKLTDKEKVLALYVLTGPQTNRLGLYFLSLATAAEDLSTVQQTLAKRLDNVCQTFGWWFDKRARVIYIPTWFKWNPPENENVMKGSLKDLNEIPPCGLMDAFARNVETLPETLRPTFAEGLRQRFPKGLPIQDQYQEGQVQEQELKAALRASHSNDGMKTNTNAPDLDSKVIAIARRVIGSNGTTTSVDLLIDHVQQQCRVEGIEVTRATARAAVSTVREGRPSP